MLRILAASDRLPEQRSSARRISSRGSGEPEAPAPLTLVSSR